jgi:hypothetical protein
MSRQSAEGEATDAAWDVGWDEREVAGKKESTRFAPARFKGSPLEHSLAERLRGGNTLHA